MRTAEQVLKDLADEATNSVEYGDWPELQELVDEAREILSASQDKGTSQ